MVLSILSCLHLLVLPSVTDMCWVRPECMSRIQFTDVYLTEHVGRESFGQRQDPLQLTGGALGISRSGQKAVGAVQWRVSSYADTSQVCLCVPKLYLQRVNEELRNQSSRDGQASEHLF